MEGTPNKSVQSFAGSRTEKSTGSSHHREAEQNDSFTRREYTCADFIQALRLIDQVLLFETSISFFFHVLFLN